MNMRWLPRMTAIARSMSAFSKPGRAFRNGWERPAASRSVGCCRKAVDRVAAHLAEFGVRSIRADRPEPPGTRAKDASVAAVAIGMVPPQHRVNPCLLVYGGADLATTSRPDLLTARPAASGRLFGSAADGRGVPPRCCRSNFRPAEPERALLQKLRPCLGAVQAGTDPGS